MIVDVDGERVRPDLARWGVLAVAAVVGVVSLALSPWYGYHRDELYYRMLAEDLSWGYYDQLGPVTPVLIRLSTGIFGDTLWALRVPCALAVAATVVLTALVARELGGGRRAQLIAAIGSAVSAFPLMIAHTMLTSAVDVPLTLLTLLFVTKALLRGDSRWWLAVGAVIGVALYNKPLIVLVALAIAVALLIFGPRSALLRPALWGGALLVLVIAAPNLIFQVTHGWPSLEVAAGLTEDNGAGNRIGFVPLQLVLLGPFLVPVWIAGLVGLLRDERWRPVRALGGAYLAGVVIVIATGGRADYLVPQLLVLLAAGCVLVDGWLADRAGRTRLLAAGLALNGVLAAVIALPLVPRDAVGSTPLPAINQLVADQVGWPELGDQVTAVYRSLPERDRPNTIALTANYGEAGAIHRYGPDELSVYSGHNHLHRAGPPPPTAQTVITVGLRAGVQRLFASCEQVAEIDNRAGVDNEEQGLPIQVCRGPARSWPEVWPDLLHYD